MINVSTIPSAPPPRGTAAPTRLAGGDFKDALDGLSVAPLADATVGLPIVKIEASVPPTAMPCMVAPSVELPVAATVDPALAPAIPAATTEPDSNVSLLPGLPTKRQALADDGKTLPKDVPDDDPSRDVIWLPTGLMLPVPAPVPIARVAMTPGLRTTTVPALSPPTTASGTTPITAATPAQARAQSGDAIAPPLPSPNGAPASAGVAARSDAPIVSAKDGAPTPRLPETTKPELPARPENTVTATAQPALPQAQAQQVPAVLPAGQAFAAAITAAVQQGRDDREGSDRRTPLAIATAALERVHAPAVAAPADARQAALDLRQDSGLQGMIDHIEVLRDGANAGDTRIRLVPDALGAVDVSVRRDGDRLHVHFNAESQASARLIAEAQPRLAELADARGVKLGQTSVDSGDGQSRQQQPAPPIQFIRPAAAGDGIETLDDLRVA